MDATASDFDSELGVSGRARGGCDDMRLPHAKLREILELQVGEEYLQRHGLNGRTDVRGKFPKMRAGCELWRLGN